MGQRTPTETHTKTNKQAIDLTLDYHAHILPGCDHGCDRAQTAVRQLELAAAAGIRVVCATSHFYPQQETVERFLRRRQACFERLSPLLREDLPRVRLGAEVLICPGMERMEGLPGLCLEGSRELLLEMPFYRWPAALWDTLYELMDRSDLQVILAHADRYPPSDINTLIDNGAVLQLNADCLTHPLRRKRYLDWIRAGAVRYLGSDIHMLGEGYRDWEKCAGLLKKQSGKRGSA